MSEGTAQQVLERAANWHLYHGDCIELLRSLPDASCDSLVTDPPAGIGFMSGKDRCWDDPDGGMGGSDASKSPRDAFVARMTRIFTEAYRVLKPGAHGVVWALPRTSGWTQMALEDAGFYCVDQISHLFGSGFPKSVNVSKAIDEKDFRAWLKLNPAEAGFLKRVTARAKKLQNARETRALSRKLIKRVRSSLRKRAGLEREVTGTYSAGGNAGTPTNEKGGTYVVGAASSAPVELSKTRGATEKSRQWDGYGTALKPSHEVWWLIRKPVGNTIAENVVEHGTGALNIDGCRIKFSGESDKAAAAAAQRLCQDSERTAYSTSLDNGEESLQPYLDGMDAGRWPSNLLFSHDHRCQKSGVASVPANPTWDTANRATEPAAFTGEAVSTVQHGGEQESVDVWSCVDGCPVRALAIQSGLSTTKAAANKTSSPNYKNQVYGPGMGGPVSAENQYEDSGSAARYFPQFQWDPELDVPFRYLAKASRAETEAGLQHFRLRTGAEATSSDEGQARLDSPRTGSGRTGGVRNIHPTKKPIELIRWLARLVTPPRGVVLVPFGGSGSEGVGALLEGFRVIMAELNDTDAEPFVSIARARLSYVEGREFKPRASLAAAQAPKQTSLFGVVE